MSDHLVQKIYKRKVSFQGFTGSSFEIHTHSGHKESRSRGKVGCDLPDMNLAATQGSLPLTEHSWRGLRSSTSAAELERGF